MTLPLTTSCSDPRPWGSVQAYVAPREDVATSSQEPAMRTDVARGLGTVGTTKVVAADAKQRRAMVAVDGIAMMMVIAARVSAP